MAADVEVHVDDRAIITALNTPGGAVYEWRDQAAEGIIGIAIANSPVNDVLNAQHRGGVVGTFKASWAYDRVGSNGHRVRATVFNGADHAEFVEFGRAPSKGVETFSWRSFTPPGDIQTRLHGTIGYRGRHILRDATNARGAATGDWGPVS